MRLPKPKEAEVQRAIMAYLRLRGAHAVRVNSGAVKTEDRFIRFNHTVGCSDVLACFEGRFLALEIKRDAKGKATEQQQQFIGEVRRAGGIAAVVWSVEQVRELLDTIEGE